MTKKANPPVKVTVRNEYGATVFLPGMKLKKGEECEMSMDEYKKYAAYLKIVT